MYFLKKLIWLIISVILTLVIFEYLSWYHFGDSITKVIGIRFLIVLSIIFFIGALSFKD